MAAGEHYAARRAGLDAARGGLRAEIYPLPVDQPARDPRRAAGDPPSLESTIRPYPSFCPNAMRRARAKIRAPRSLYDDLRTHPPGSDADDLHDAIVDLDVVAVRDAIVEVMAPAMSATMTLEEFVTVLRATADLPLAAAIVADIGLAAWKARSKSEAWRAWKAMRV